MAAATHHFRGRSDVEEKIKWSFPHFDYKGMMCSMAAFAQHAAFGFWKGALILGDRNRNATGHFGRIAKRSDLPSNTVLAGYVKKAAALNDQGVKLPRVVKKPAPKTIKVPALIAAALEHDPNAQSGFDALSPSHRRE